jgi:hypothetical protein
VDFVFTEPSHFCKEIFLLNQVIFTQKKTFFSHQKKKWKTLPHSPSIIKLFYLYQIPSGMIPYKFAKDALEILKPIILEHNKSRYTYERYLRSREEQEDDEKKPSMFDIDPEDEKEH